MHSAGSQIDQGARCDPLFQLGHYGAGEQLRPARLSIFVVNRSESRENDLCKVVSDCGRESLLDQLRMLASRHPDVIVHCKASPLRG